jgi:hypothetical protein
MYVHHALKKYGGVKIQLCHSGPQHWMVVRGPLHAPAALPLGEQPPDPMAYETGWASQLVWMLWRRETSFVLTGTRTPTP